MTKTAQLIYEGKTFELPIVEGTLGDKAIDITRLRSQAGLITYDPGYMNTGPCKSAITFVDGENDVSPFEEWRWSMMGLAGRDPIFFAQLESEIQLNGLHANGAFSPEEIQNLCLHCHGVMGQRQFVADHPGGLFTVEIAMASDPDDPHSKYGGLARDGVSCMVCHQIQDDNLPLTEIETGDFLVNPPQNGVLEAFGPYQNPNQAPMLKSLDVRPMGSDHIRDSRLCASCHTVNLPVLDQFGQIIDKKYEQATYLEWVNSAFADGRSQAQSCQECHMPNRSGGPQELEFKIANIQDQDFPETDNLAPAEDIQVFPRGDYRRHLLMSINTYALTLFQNYPDILGVRIKSFFTGRDAGLQQAINNSVDGALNQSVRLDILDTSRAGNVITSRVQVRNIVGHRLPSGVGFRRLFLEFVVTDSTGETVWASGLTNNLGVILGPDGNPLPSESHAPDGGGQQTYQPHYQVIDSQDEVQIYEELIKDASGKFSTSFLTRVEDVKDNRLLPAGWTLNGPAGFQAEFAEATKPHGAAASDPDFTDGTGSDTITYQTTLPASAQGPFKVKATLYTQSIPPNYLSDRFNDASGPATKRLHFLTSHLDTDDTLFPDWKLLMRSSEATVP